MLVAVLQPLCDPGTAIPEYRVVNAAALDASPIMAAPMIPALILMATSSVTVGIRLPPTKTLLLISNPDKGHHANMRLPLGAGRSGSGMGGGRERNGTVRIMNFNWPEDAENGKLKSVNIAPGAWS